MKPADSGLLPILQINRCERCSQESGPWKKCQGRGARKPGTTVRRRRDAVERGVPFWAATELILDGCRQPAVSHRRITIAQPGLTDRWIISDYSEQEKHGLGRPKRKNQFLTRAQIPVWHHWLPEPLAGFPITLLYSANSDGEQIISLTSKFGGCNLKRNLLRATQGFVYIFGSSMITVSSSVS